MGLFGRKKLKTGLESNSEDMSGGNGTKKDAGNSRAEPDDKTPEKEMSFVGHLEELRKRIIIVLIVFAVAFIPAYIYHAKILEFINCSACR